MRFIFGTIRQSLPSVFLCIAAWLLAGGLALAQHIDITPERSQVTLDSDLRFWASLGPYPGPAFEAYQAGLFTPERRSVTHGMAHARETWFGITVKNASFDDGRAGDPFVLILDAPLNVGFRLFVIREDGLTETLLDYSVFQPFDARQHSVTRLKSPEFLLAPGETVTILAHLQLGVLPGYSAMLFRPEALSEASFGWGVTTTAFYAFSLSLLLLSLGFQIAMRSWLGCGYVAMFLLFLMLIAHSDGLLFRIVYPNTPSVHHPFGIGLLMGASSIGFGILGQSLFASRHRRRGPLAKLVLGLFVLCLVTFTGFLWVQTNWMAYLSFALAVLSIGLNVFLPNEISQTDSNPNIGIRLVTLFAATLLSVVFVLSLVGSTDWITTRALNKVTFLVIALTVMTFLTGNLFVLRQRYVRAVEARLAAMEEQTEKNRQLLETERAYNRAREMAAARQRQLATASHDIKQPLMSLRATFDAISMDMDQSVRDRLQNAFLYLEDLSKSYVDRADPTDNAGALASDNSAPEPDDETGKEAYSLSVPLNTVEQMFKGEAVSKGLRLRVVDSTAHTTAPPIVLMRILTNLVSNAVKNTSKGGVLIGYHRASQSILVVDTGIGMCNEDLDRFQEAYQKGDGSTGHGLGLSVCFELAEKNALPLTVSSEPGRGTVCAVSLKQHLPEC